MKKSIFQKGFIQIPLAIIIIGLIAVAFLGAGLILHKTGKLASLEASISNLLVNNKSENSKTEEPKPEGDQQTELISLPVVEEATTTVTAQPQKQTPQPTATPKNNPLPKLNIAPTPESPTPTQQAQTQETQYYTREEANDMLKSMLESFKPPLEVDRRKLLAILIVSETTLEENIANRIKMLATFKASHDVLRGTSYVADFFTNYAKSELDNQQVNILRIKSDSYLIDESIKKFVLEYDQQIQQGAPILKKDDLIFYMKKLSNEHFNDEDLIDNAIDKQNTLYNAASSKYFSFIDKEFSDITSYLAGSRFFGYQCLDKCIGHEQGWLRALNNKISLTALCGGNSQSFIEGCYVYVKQSNP